MKYLGIDYGSTRIGLAVSDAEGKIAFPRTAVKNDSQAISHIENIIRDDKIEKIIIGDTRTISGRDNAITPKAEKFIAALENATSLEIIKAFEGWSSIEASRYAPDSGSHDDSAAAAIILQRFLEMKRVQ
jgi:putative holliday junction resolvase